MDGKLKIKLKWNSCAITFQQNNNNNDNNKIYMHPTIFWFVVIKNNIKMYKRQH